MGRRVFDHFRTLLLAHSRVHDKVHDCAGLLGFRRTLVI